MKKPLINLALAAASVVITLAAGEILARIFLDYQERLVRQRNSANILTQVVKKDIFQPANPGNYANRANATVHWWGHDIHTDSLGCRTGVAAPDAARNILFLGDSMIFGLGLPDSSTIPSLLQADVNRLTPEHPCRVINAGVVGYDFQSYLYQLQRLAPEVRPDLVLVGICYNDLLPNEDPYGNVFADRLKAPEDRKAAEEQHGCSCKPSDEATRVADAHSASNACSCQMTAGSGATSSCYESSLVCHCRSITKKVKRIVQYSALYQMARRVKSSIKTHPQPLLVNNQAKAASLSRAPGLVEEFISSARDLGVPVAFVYFPEYESLGQISPIIYTKLLQEAGQPVLDLSFSSSLERNSYFMRQNEKQLKPDIHFNLHGSELVAREIARWLVEKGLWK